MPFPVEEKFITETEMQLNVKFPPIYKCRMIELNGGTVIKNGNGFDDYEFNLFPFFDKSTKKRIIRTCSHIIIETESAKKWFGFPENVIVIGSDGFGNHILLKHNGDGILYEKIYFWNHETNKTRKIADNINQLE